MPRAAAKSKKQRRLTQYAPSARARGVSKWQLGFLKHVQESGVAIDTLNEYHQWSVLSLFNRGLVVRNGQSVLLTDAGKEFLNPEPLYRTNKDLSLSPHVAAILSLVRMQRAAGG